MRHGARRMVLVMAVAAAASAAAPMPATAGGNADAEAACDGDTLHRSVWPAARDYYNSTIASEEKQIARLRPDEYAAPGKVQRRPDACLVLYGGNKAGPYIIVETTPTGRILKIKGGYASK